MYVGAGGCVVGELAARVWPRVHDNEGRDEESAPGRLRRAAVADFPGRRHRRPACEDRDVAHPFPQKPVQYKGVGLLCHGDKVDGNLVCAGRQKAPCWRAGRHSARTPLCADARAVAAHDAGDGHVKHAEIRGDENGVLEARVDHLYVFCLGGAKLREWTADDGAQYVAVSVARAPATYRVYHAVLAVYGGVFAEKGLYGAECVEAFRERLQGSQYVVCCRVLQGVAVCCRMVQCAADDAVRCSVVNVLQCDMTCVAV